MAALPPTVSRQPFGTLSRHRVLSPKLLEGGKSTDYRNGMNDQRDDNRDLDLWGITINRKLVVVSGGLILFLLGALGSWVLTYIALAREVSAISAKIEKLEKIESDVSEVKNKSDGFATAKAVEDNRKAIAQLQSDVIDLTTQVAKLTVAVDELSRRVQSLEHVAHFDTAIITSSPIAYKDGEDTSSYAMIVISSKSRGEIWRINVDGMIPEDIVVAITKSLSGAATAVVFLPELGHLSRSVPDSIWPEASALLVGMKSDPIAELKREFGAKLGLVAINPSNLGRVDSWAKLTNQLEENANPYPSGQGLKFFKQ